MKKKIDPSKATPHAPLSLRSEPKVHAGAPQAIADDGGGPDSGGEGDDDEEDEDALAEHEPLRADAEASHLKAAEAWKDCAGTDSAAAHQAAMEAEDMASEAGAKAKAASMKLLGAEPAPAGASALPASPPPGAARALAALAGPTATAQLELAQLAGWARDAMGKLAARTMAGASAKLDLALVAMAKLPKIEADRKASAITDRLVAAVHAGMDRAKAFKINDDGTPGAPLAVWTRLDPVALDEVLTVQGFAVGAPVARSTLIHASPDGGGEAGLAARAAASGMDIETRRAAETSVRNSQQQENAR